MYVGSKQPRSVIGVTFTGVAGTMNKGVQIHTLGNFCAEMKTAMQQLAGGI